MPIPTACKSLLALSLAAFCLSAFAAEPTPNKPTARRTTAKPRVLVTISKETTFITEPLRKDGYPDYVAALNQRLSKGVTPENNASVLFWRAAGPETIDVTRREQFFQRLGIPPLPENGDYFVELNVFAKRQEAKADHGTATITEDAMCDQVGIVSKRPWSKSEFPALAEWLAVNDRPLALVLEGCARPRRYDPLVVHDLLMDAYPKGGWNCRDFANALLLRAMLYIQEGKADAAWTDLFACHRMARLVGQGPTRIEAMNAITIDGMAAAGDQALLQHAKLTATQIANMRRDLDTLPPLCSLADIANIYKRFVFLDSALWTARGGDSPPKGVMDSLAKAFFDPAIDWNIVLRMGNFRFDQAVDALRKPTHAERADAMAAIEKEMAKASKLAKNATTQRLLRADNPRDAASKFVGQKLLDTTQPAFSGAHTVVERATMHFELTKLAFALAAYRADRGSYPAKLADLTPNYVRTTPKDVFNKDADLHYTTKDNSYLLYSVGPNGKDDGGKSYDDRKNNERWDDLTVRISSPAH